MFKQAMLIAMVLLEMAAGALRSRRNRAILIAVVLLLTCTTAYGLWRLCRTDPNLKHVQQLQAKLSDPKLSTQERVKRMQELGKAMEPLNQEQRRQAMRSGGEQMRREWGRRAAIYAALPPDKKEAFLDQQLAEMQRMREAMRAAAQQAGRQANAGNAGNAQGGRQGPNQPNAKRGNQGRVAGQGRMDGAKRFLDSTTPAERGQGEIYMQDLMQRAAQNGTPMPFGGRGGGGGFF